MPNEGIHQYPTHYIYPFQSSHLVKHSSLHRHQLLAYRWGVSRILQERCKMKILNWMHNKITGRQASKRCSTTMNLSYGHGVAEARKEEFSDWPHGLLAIGTFGNNQLKEGLGGHESSEMSHPLYDLSEFTHEEVSKLQTDIAKLLKLKPTEKTDESGVPDKANLPLENLLNYTSTFEPDPNNCEGSSDDSEEASGDTQRSMRVAKSKDKEMNVDKRTGIRQRSISFLLKNMFACQGGFPPLPSRNDPISESRMEKLLRTILHRKIYPQSSVHTSTKRYLRNIKQASKAEVQDEMLEKRKKDCKWVKTDSDFIVLEI